ncbi:5-hydroxyisourate hydrolase [hydrothermal vent metagenome]|uniref:hydroxyisourate hydrolase n=1 Tax=hydrothermal vent metagenome TaxID=652676 RepID=A0A3B0RU38_9ZZZZ
MTGLTTHILDTANGKPANGVNILLFRGEETQPLGQWQSNADGRCDAPLLAENQMQAGVYRLEFAVAAYFRAQGHTLPEPPFLDKVVIRFGIAQTTAHYHVPLLVSPFGYSTYRGS